jgi:hypothetical protein
MRQNLYSRFVERSRSDSHASLIRKPRPMNGSLIRVPVNFDQVAAIIDVLTEEYAGTNDPERRKKLALEISSLAEAVSGLKYTGHERRGPIPF